MDEEHDSKNGGDETYTGSTDNFGQLPGAVSNEVFEQNDINMVPFDLLNIKGYNEVPLYSNHSPVHHFQPFSQLHRNGLIPENHKFNNSLFSNLSPERNSYAKVNFPVASASYNDSLNSVPPPLIQQTNFSHIESYESQPKKSYECDKPDAQGSVVEDKYLSLLSGSIESWGLDFTEARAKPEGDSSSDPLLYDKAHLNMSAEEVLKFTFPDISNEILEKIFTNNNYDIETSLEVILGLPSYVKGSQNSVQTNSEQQANDENLALSNVPPESIIALQQEALTASENKKNLCRYFIMGNCLRSDCKYSHDPQKFICKFWLRGECFKGDFCEFVHNPDIKNINRDKNSAASSPNSKVESNPLPISTSDESVFPVLPNCSSRTETAASPKSHKYPSRQQQYIKPHALTSNTTSQYPESPKLFSQKNVIDKDAFFPPLSNSPQKRKEKLRPLPKEQKLHGSIQMKKSYNYIDLESISPVTKAPEFANTGNLPNSTQTMMEPFSAVARALPQDAPHQSKYKIETTPTPNFTHGHLNQRKVNIGWLETGDSVSHIYYKYRAEAIERALQRNRLMQRATEAYMTGSKAAARAFSLGAHKLNEELIELHFIAARNIFEKRNPDLFDNIGYTRNYPFTRTSSLPIKTVDLHGLHPDEAVFFLNESIEKLKKCLENYKSTYVDNIPGSGPTLTVAVVTGTGHHSHKGKSKLLPEIENWLIKSKLYVRSCYTENKHGGSFIVELK